MNNNPIDFVILWVDPSDVKWQEERNRYYSNVNNDKKESRYRDWDNLQYLFRGIEKFAPWINKVHFVTYGHIPEWLNIDHPKLNIVKHEVFIPKEYLPTFNSDSIELNLYRISELSENFVLFNDDMFLLSPLNETDVFKDDIPCDAALLNVHCYDPETIFTLAPIMNIGIINKYYNFHTILKDNFKLWYNLSYGINLLRNIYLLPCPRFPGMRMDHLPCSHKKSTFKKLWDLEFDILDQTSKSKFRNRLSVNHWLMKEWNMVNGNFVPRSPKIGKSFAININNIEHVANYVKNQKSKMVCLNDTEMSKDEYLYCKNKLIESFNYILQERSKFEL